MERSKLKINKVRISSISNTDMNIIKGGYYGVTAPTPRHISMGLHCDPMGFRGQD